jgi:hypothetical protein
MNVRIQNGLALLGLLLAFPLFAAVPPNNGPGTYDILVHSSCCYQSDGVFADDEVYHSFFEAPETPAVSPGVTVLLSTDFASLVNYDMFYIAQIEADDLSGPEMTSIMNWTAAGGILVINNHTGSSPGFSEFGAAFGSNYEFTGVTPASYENMEVTDPLASILNFPNALDNTTLSGWGSSVHGAFGYRTPVLCTAGFGAGSIILVGFDPECGNGCHDDHVNNPDSTASGGEMWENFVLYAGPYVATPVPASSNISLAILGLMLGLMALVNIQRRTA